jgi:DNA-binding NtrC family response regulator
MGVWHTRCFLDTVAALALVVERDPSLCRLMRNTVARADYDVIQCSNPPQLKLELAAAAVVEAPALLMVVSLEIARECSAEISALLRSRTREHRPAVDMAFTVEFGAHRQLPALGTYALAGVLEKPFQLDELQIIARRSRTPLEVASTA